jgi:hypothetical protein
MNELITLEQLNKETADYLRKGYNLVGNVSTIRQQPPGHRAAMEIVHVNPDPTFRDVYKQKGGGLSLTHQAIKKFANAANIRWILVDPVEGRCSDTEITYRAIGRAKSLDGSFREVEKHYSFDLEARGDEIRSAKESQARYFLSERGRKDAPGDFRFKSVEEASDWIDKKVKDELIQLRKVKVSRAQTGAQDRVVREIMQLKDVYQPAELQHPFIVLKMIFELDPSIAMDRQFLLEQNLGASNALYGKPPSLEKVAGVQDARVSLPTYPAADAIPYHDVELTETEQIVQGVDPAEVLPPSQELNAELDFHAMDQAEQIAAINDLIGRKSWNGKLNKELMHFTEQERTQFHAMLRKLPDPKDVQRPTLPWT